ncbi:hypothetical protein B9Z55_028085 [Caenorhabditis nigoni]|uniref:Uncharacterized protein n=1 Tax=Caenorhabditis nigoni TaxID=1611254 RepID=A0A2G5SD91_9PELO|nr:hypothetical protein B9Z55_028085 [Caenorhabditis nigoni]
MSHKFVACDAARERKNRARAFVNQLAFNHAIVQHSWATLDIDDELTCEYINRMESSELERMKFELDVLTHKVHPSIKFLKAEDNPLPFVVKLTAPRGRGNFNPQYQQRNNNWTRENFAQEQNYDHRVDTYQAPQHFNRPMQLCFSGPFQIVPPMAVPIHSTPVRYVPVNHGYNNTFSAAPMQNGYFQSNRSNGDYYPSPTESRDSGVYTGSSSNGYEGSQNIQYIPASYPRVVRYASVIPLGESPIHDPSQGVPPQSADFNYPMQQYYSGSSHAMLQMPIQFSPGLGYAPVQYGSNNTVSTAHSYSQSNHPNGCYYSSPTESRDSAVYTSASSYGSERCQNVQHVLASSPNDVPYASAIPPEVPQIHDPSPSSSRSQDAYRKRQTMNAKSRIQTTIKVEPNYESNPQIISGQHEKPQSTVGVDNRNKDTSLKVSKDVAILPVALEKPAESIEATDFDTKEIEKRDTSDEATVTVAMPSNSESVLPTAHESAKFEEEVEPPRIGTTVEDNIQTTTELELEKESSIVTDDVSVASNTDLDCELSKLDKPVQSLETTDCDNEDLKEKTTSNEAIVPISKPSESESLLPRAPESAKFVKEVKPPSIETTAECDIQTTIELPVEMSEILVLQHEEPQSAIGMENVKNDQKLQLRKDFDTRPNVAENMSGTSNKENDPSTLEKPVMSTPIKPSEVETEELKGHTTSDERSGLAEDPEFPELRSKALDSVEKCSKDANMPMVENDKPSKPLMSEVLLAAIEKDKGTVDPCLIADPIMQRDICQKEYKNLKSGTNSQGSKRTPLSHIKNSEKQFHKNTHEASKHHLSAKQEQDSNSGWKTVKSSSRDAKNTEKLAVPAEQPPVAKDSKRSPSSKELKASTTATSISPTRKTKQSVEENLAESIIDTPDQPEKSQVSKSSQKKSMKNKKKDKNAKTANASVVEDFDNLLEQFKEEDKKSAEKNGEVREVVVNTANGQKKKRTIRQYRAERDDAERKEQEMFDSLETEGQRLEVAINMALRQFFEELNYCIITRTPMVNWPECPMRELSECEEVTRKRDELVLDFIHERIVDQIGNVETTAKMRELFYRFLRRHYNSNLGFILEPLAKILLERDITYEDEQELVARMLNQQELRADWKAFYPGPTNEC